MNKREIGENVSTLIKDLERNEKTICQLGFLPLRIHRRKVSEHLAFGFEGDVKFHNRWLQRAFHQQKRPKPKCNPNSLPKTNSKLAIISNHTLIKLPALRITRKWN